MTFEQALASADRGLLVATVGLPRSGKSTWARKSGLAIVSPDALRLTITGQAYVPSSERYVWTAAELMLRSLYAAGCFSVVFDSCAGTRRRRDELRAMLPDGVTLAFKVFDADAETCLERATETGRPDLRESIERMSAKYEPVAADEGIVIENDPEADEPG